MDGVKPIRTATMPLTYHGPSSDIGDLPCERMQAGQIRSVWKPSEIERARIAHGDNIEIVLYAEPIPPLSVIVTDEQEA